MNGISPSPLSLRYNYIPIAASIQGLNVLPNCFFVQSRARRESHPAGLARLARVPRVALLIATLTRGDSLPPSSAKEGWRDICVIIAPSTRGKEGGHATPSLSLSGRKQFPIRGVDEFRWRKGSERVRAVAYDKSFPRRDAITSGQGMMR